MHLPLKVLLFCIVASASSASAQDAEAALKRFEGKILILRHPLQSKSQQYDSDGKVLKGGDEGPWTVYGGVLIDHIALMPDKLRVEGRRILFLFLNQQFTALELKKVKDRGNPPFPPSLELEIRLDQPFDSAEQARIVMSRVFALNTADLLDSLPDFWRTCLTGQLIYDPSRSQEAEFSWQVLPPSSHKPARNAGPDTSNDSSGTDTAQVVFHVGPEVKAPKAQHTPEPEFSEIARYEKFQGTIVVNLIVGTDGNVHDIRLVRPLGLGLDEAARSRLQIWRFRPGTHNGQPVAVEMNIEVSFNLY